MRQMSHMPRVRKMQVRRVYVAAKMSHPAQQRDETQHQPRQKTNQIKRLPVHLGAPNCFRPCVPSRYGP